MILMCRPKQQNPHLLLPGVEGRFAHLTPPWALLVFRTGPVVWVLAAVGGLFASVQSGDGGVAGAVVVASSLNLTANRGLASIGGVSVTVLGTSAGSVTNASVLVSNASATGNIAQGTLGRGGVRGGRRVVALCRAGGGGGGHKAVLVPWAPRPLHCPASLLSWPTTGSAGGMYIAMQSEASSVLLSNVTMSALTLVNNTAGSEGW